MNPACIRTATADDVAGLPRMQVAAGQLFRELGMDLVADGAAPDLGGFESAVETGDLLVAELDGEIVGFVRTRALDGALHVEQLTVAPSAQGQGIGRALMLAAEASARGRGFDRMTLTTFRDVPFNGPFYRRLGWRDLAEGEWTPGLRAERQEEGEAGLDAWPRVAMGCSLTSPPSDAH